MDAAARRRRQDDGGNWITRWDRRSQSCVRKSFSSSSFFCCSQRKRERQSFGFVRRRRRRKGIWGIFAQETWAQTWDLRVGATTTTRQQTMLQNFTRHSIVFASKIAESKHEILLSNCCFHKKSTYLLNQLHTTHVICMYFFQPSSCFSSNPQSTRQHKNLIFVTFFLYCI